MKSKTKKKITFKKRQIWILLDSIEKSMWDFFEIPKVYRRIQKPYCPVINFTEGFKNASKAVFEDEVAIKIEGVE